MSAANAPGLKEAPEQPAEMAEDTSFEGLQARPTGKRRGRKQKPKEEEWVATRHSILGRRKIISECRVPDSYLDKDGGVHPIGKGAVKAVLQEIGSWPPGQAFSSNEYVAHSTEYSESQSIYATLR